MRVWRLGYSAVAVERGMIGDCIAILCVAAIFGFAAWMFYRQGG